ncbi:MAG: pentapeptide repeat-containing protein, partial [Thermoguttaceae bacterium]|nr:pentapeptide repeat-containing protein [Thermoguttaceae bacterium]
MDANSSAVRLVKYCAASCLAVCFILTGCDGDVAFVLPVGDETATATLAPDASTPESLSRRVDEETERNDDESPDAIDATNLDSVASSADDDSVQESLLESDVKEEEEGEVVDVDKLFSTDPTIDRLKPTKYILVDGEPALLEDGIDLTGKDLSGARINNVTLSHVNFHHAKLNGADLSQARFYRCNFQRV